MHALVTDLTGGPIASHTTALCSIKGHCCLRSGKVKLPTGNEKIVTRCPLQLEFHPLAPGQKEEARLHYKQSDSTPVTSKVLALHDIAREVAAAQDELAGTQYGVVNKLIRLETFIEDSPVSLLSSFCQVGCIPAHISCICFLDMVEGLEILQELTLIDLPGHTISPIGDQKETIGEEILTMWRLHMAGQQISTQKCASPCLGASLLSVRALLDDSFLRYFLS